MAAEDHIADKGRPFTGAEYLASLNDGREVYIDGERIANVANHPAYRNSARSIARLYDALHAPETKDVLTCPTDTGSDGYTHRFFRAARSSADLFAQRDAIAAWARLSYGWMGRTADYKAALTNTLGANAAWYGDYADNARAWHRRTQESVLFMNHAIVNPPIDRNKPASEVKDVYVSIDEETDAGIVVSGAKVVATASALTHYNFLSQTSPAVMEDPSLAVVFMMAMNSPGVKMFSRVSYERAAGLNGSPFDYPLSSRFDENDAILVLDRVLIPWENVLLKGDGKKIMAFQGRSGFMQGYCFQGCTRLAVKLDFLAGLLAKALKATGGDEFRGNQAMLGEVISYRNLMWTLTDAMAGAPVSWVGEAVLPSMQAAMSYRALAPEIYPRIKDIIEKTVASGLIYLPSSVKDFQNPDIDPYLRQYVRGSGDMDYKERIKIMKLLWDSIGTEFGGRHELYERNYAGALEDIRLQALMIAQRGGAMNQMQALVDRCMADYDENGWTGEDWLDPSA